MEGHEFKIFTDNQVLKYLFSKADLSRREAGYLETLGNFGIFPITLKSGKVHVLSNAFSRIPQIDSKAEDHSEVSDCEDVQLGPQNIIESYDDDQFFGPIWRALQGF